MKNEEQKILDIFNKDVTLKAPINQEKQEIIKKLLIETFDIRDGNNETE